MMALGSFVCAFPLTCVSWARAPCVVSSAAGRDSRCRWGQRAADQSVDNSLCRGARRETCDTQTHTKTPEQQRWDEQTDTSKGESTRKILAGSSAAKLTTMLLTWHSYNSLEVWRVQPHELLLLFPCIMIEEIKNAISARATPVQHTSVWSQIFITVQIYVQVCLFSSLKAGL